jgi:hypothetical protein
MHSLRVTSRSMVCMVKRRNFVAFVYKKCLEFYRFRTLSHNLAFRNQSSKSSSVSIQIVSNIDFYKICIMTLDHNWSFRIPNPQKSSSVVVLKLSLIWIFYKFCIMTLSGRYTRPLPVCLLCINCAECALYR